MQFLASYQSPFGPISLACDSEALTGLWFDGQRFDRNGLEDFWQREEDRSIFVQAKAWLDCYFSGKVPSELPPIRIPGEGFSREVSQCLLHIPYGKVVTYGAVCRMLGRDASSSRAVGHVVSHNPISLMVPCHRVVGSGGRLTGYAGGIARKRALLESEGIGFDAQGNCLMEPPGGQNEAKFCHWQ